MGKPTRRPFIIFPLLLLSLSLPASADLKSAKVSKRQNDVKIFHAKQAPRGAKINDILRLKSILRTGRRSRAEVKYSDNSVTRMGANTIFSLNKKRRKLHLKKGTILIQVKKNSQRTTIKGGTVNAAIRGTTVVMHNDEKTGIVRYLLLEGASHIDIDGEDKKGSRIELKPGQMLSVDTKNGNATEIVNVDVAAYVAGSSLTDSGFFGELPNGAGEAIIAVAESQIGMTDLVTITDISNIGSVPNSPLDFPTGTGTNVAGPISGGPGGLGILPPGGSVTSSPPLPVTTF